MLNFPKWFQPNFIFRYIIGAVFVGGGIVWLLTLLF